MTKKIIIRIIIVYSGVHDILALSTGFRHFLPAAIWQYSCFAEKKCEKSAATLSSNFMMTDWMETVIRCRWTDLMESPSNQSS